jgi:hypothetical protein
VDNAPLNCFPQDRAEKKGAGGNHSVSSTVVTKATEPTHAVTKTRLAAIVAKAFMAAPVG